MHAQRQSPDPSLTDDHACPRAHTSPILSAPMHGRTELRRSDGLQHRRRPLPCCPACAAATLRRYLQMRVSHGRGRLDQDGQLDVILFLPLPDETGG